MMVTSPPVHTLTLSEQACDRLAGIVGAQLVELAKEDACSRINFGSVIITEDTAMERAFAESARAALYEILNALKAAGDSHAATLLGPDRDGLDRQTNEAVERIVREAQKACEEGSALKTTNTKRKRSTTIAIRNGTAKAWPKGTLCPRCFAGAFGTPSEKIGLDVKTHSSLWCHRCNLVIQE